MIAQIIGGVFVVTLAVLAIGCARVAGMNDAEYRFWLGGMRPRPELVPFMDHDGSVIFLRR